MAQYGWTPSRYTISYKRKILSVRGNVITLDAPVFESIDPSYSQAVLQSFEWPGHLENVGIEHVLLDSTYSSPTDDNHTESGVTFSNTEHGWVKDIEARHFGYSAVTIDSSSSNISVLDSRSIDPISQIIGGRRYSFNNSGQRNLFRNCFTKNGRHDFVTGAAVAGPNVFLRGKSTQPHSNIGPHHRWAVGTLFDNIVSSDGEIDVENRADYGTGQGWAGAQTLFWNCTAKHMIVQSPPSNVNWAIGSKAVVTGVGHKVTGKGYVELTGSTPWPESLYEQQMCDRLGKFCTPPEVDPSPTPKPSPSPSPKPTPSPSPSPKPSPVERPIVTAKSNDGNVPANTIDGNLNTRWSALGDGQWIQYEYKTARLFSLVSIAFHKGTRRRASFDIWISPDRNTWTKINGFKSSGSSLNLQSFNVNKVPGRFVRIVGHGTNLDKWNSFTEVLIN